MLTTDSPTVAIVGATGLVGREMLAVLEQRAMPVGALRLLASPRSAGATVTFRGDAHEVRPLDDAALDGADLVLLAAGGDVSRAVARTAVARGATVIDNSSAFRLDEDVPLVVPEVNGELLDELDGPALVANPNCSTIIALVALTPLHRAAGIARMVVATYQAASGGGLAMLQELDRQVEDHAAGRPYRQAVLDRPYLFNLFSHDSAIGPDGCNAEETKLVRETRKIWNDDAVGVTATCVRVPVRRAHAEAINVTLRAPLDEDEARRLLETAPGVRVVDDRAANRFPEPVEASGRDEVLVGRIRADRSQPAGLGLDLFACGDQLRKGAALNAVQIAERLLPSRAAV